MASETSGSYADRLVDRIDAGDLDPEHVDIEPFVTDDDTVLTPALAERLPQETIEAYNEAVTARDAQALRETQADLGETQRETLAQLEAALDDDAEPPTAEVQLGEATVTVTTRLPGRVEECLDRINAEANKPPEERSLRSVVGDLLTAIPALIVDDEEPTDDPYDFSDPAVWEEYYRNNGSEALFRVFDTLSDPALDQSFRDERNGRGRGRSGTTHGRPSPEVSDDGH